MHDVVVIGGGAMGTAAAWALTRTGREVLVLEKYGHGHDRGGSHGATRLFRLGYDTPDWIALTRRAQEAWRSLEDETGLELLTVTGAIDHGLDRSRMAELTGIWHAAGVAGEILDAVEARQRWPGFAFAGDVLHQPDGGRLHADTALEALRRAAIAAGAEIRYDTAVAAIRTVGDAVEVHTPDGAVAARHAVVTAGSWAPGLLAGVVDLPLLRVTQEQPAHFPVIDPQAAWPSFVQWFTDDPETYGLFAPGEGVKVGFHATGPVVDPDRTDREPDEKAHEDLREYARRWLPGVDADAGVATTCLYDNTPSGDFVIDRVGPVTVATGFSGHGFKFVPVIGGILADLVTGAAPVPPRFALTAHRT